MAPVTPVESPCHIEGHERRRPSARPPVRSRGDPSRREPQTQIRRERPTPRAEAVRRSRRGGGDGVQSSGVLSQEVGSERRTLEPGQANKASSGFAIHSAQRIGEPQSATPGFIVSEVVLR